MPRFTYSDELPTRRPVTECKDAIHDAFRKLGAHLESEDNSTADARMGSQLAIRLIGGLALPETGFPITIEAHVEDEGSKRVVSLRVAEAFGFGTIVGIADKYRERCQKVLADLMVELEDRLT